jgi:hypothetical protein
MVGVVVLPLSNTCAFDCGSIIHEAPDFPKNGSNLQWRTEVRSLCCCNAALLAVSSSTLLGDLPGNLQSKEKGQAMSPSSTAVPSPA